ncbi:DUF6268 family outer membrane beta-barrel protein [Mesonia sp. MT50]|uniref:DUF6268 family outer membrane beta-barrel protein n=1 Tax=Mesonia profundi TaxID=3070998 RepID=A0ABU1A1F1_9FLAO|nr:DUF6268 family outer membrane beta-barrel protein [Mesonia profundi]MDQ7917076.1 DUF6268 family outer membrane beta-barrel protein [Mesonia profundi]
MKKALSLTSLLIAFICTSFIQLQAQSTDLARIEYMRVPFSNGDQSMNRFRAFIQAPIPIKDDYLVIGAEYRKLDLDFRESAPFETGALESTQRIEASLGYVKKIKNTNWRIAARGGARIASTFETTLEKDDFIYLGAIYAINDVKNRDEKGNIIGKPYRLIVGLVYTSTPGRNYPLPLINYFRKVNETWSYTLGVPKTLLRYTFNEKNHLHAFASLDNFFANIQNPVMVPGNSRPGENISMTNVTLGLGYEFYFTDHLQYYLYAGHTVYNEYRIRDNNKDDVFVIDNDNTFYIRTGIKFKI